MEESLEKLKDINDTLNYKFKCSFQGIFKSSDPVYKVPNPVYLPKNRNYEAAMIFYSTDNYLENISPNKNNNKFHYSPDKGVTWQTITIPRGAYDLDDYNNEIKRQMVDNKHYDSKDNKSYLIFDVSLSTFLTSLEISNENYMVDFTRGDTFRKNLGFEKVKLSKGRHVSKNRIQINNIKLVNIHCDLISGGYDSEGKESDIILSYPTGKVAPGHTITIEPAMPRFLPVVKQVIKDLRFRLTDNTLNDLISKDEEIIFCIWVSQI
jgi:hypothetical protein